MMALQSGYGSCEGADVRDEREYCDEHVSAVDETSRMILDAYLSTDNFM
jgi:hypothetical protein